VILGTPEMVKGERAQSSHGGSGGYFVRTLLESPPDSSFRYVRDLILDPGSSIGDHPHQGDDEIYFIISGTGVMQVDGEQRKVGPGSAVLTRSGSHHGLVNTGSLHMRVCVACASSTARASLTAGSAETG
jgi:mannose-6-phosphate isomerase-like protein (cupin superfamily)